MESTTTNLKQLVISRCPPGKSIAFDIVSSEKRLEFQVSLETVQALVGWRLTFHNPTMPMKAIILLQGAPPVQFWSLDGQQKGQMQEASLSNLGKSIVKDENGSVLGWISWRLKRHRIFSASGNEIGILTRKPATKLPPITILPPSKAYLLDRFEFTSNDAEECDWRLFAGFVSRLVSMENSGNGS